MGIKIVDMTQDGSCAGTEIIPTSKGGNPRAITAEEISDYTIDQIEAISAGSSVTGADGVFVLQGGALKPMDIDVVAQHAIDTIWGKGAEASPDSADVMALKDGGTTEKTITLSVLAEYVRATVEATILDVSDLADGSGTLATTDYLLVTQGTTAKQITVQDIYDAIYAGLAAHVTGKTALSGPAVDADTLYVVRSGTAYKITLAQIATHAAGSAMIDGSGTSDHLAQWADSDTLQAGPAIVDSASGFAGGSDTVVPTSKAVRDEMDEIINDATAIGAALADADTILVDDGGAGTQRKSAMTRFWTYVWAKVQAATDKATAVGADILAIQDSAASNAIKELTLTNLKVFLDTVGTYETIFVPAAVMHPRTTDGCAAAAVNEYATNDICLNYYAFDGGATEEAVQFALPMPEGWNLGTVKAKFFWGSAASSTAGDTVEWGIKGGALADSDAIDAALGTPQVITDTVLINDGTDMHVSAATPALTVGGTPASGDMTVFEVYRNTDGTDDMTEDAWLFGVWIQYQRTVAPSAW